MLYPFCCCSPLLIHFCLTIPLSATLFNKVTFYLHQRVSESCPAMTEYSAATTDQIADAELLKSGLANQGRLLGQHQQTLADVTQAISELARQQSSQQQQLTQVLDSLRGLIPVVPNPVVTATHTPTLPTNTFPVCKPELFDGDPDKCSGFLLQCSVFFSNSAETTDKARIAFVISRLSGKALEWATAVWDSIANISYSDFLATFRGVFDHSLYGHASGEQLLTTTQGNRSVAAYALEFRTLAAGSGWNNPALQCVFFNGLNPIVQKELSCRDESLSLDQLISLAIRIDQLLSRRLQGAPCPAPARTTGPATPSLHTPSVPVLPDPEPMQVQRTRLTTAERQRRIQLHLCLYCGGSGHVKAECGLRPSSYKASTRGKRVDTLPRANVVRNHSLALTPKSFSLSVSITCQSVVFSALALIDSGSEGNFISADLVKEHNIPIRALQRPISIHAVDGHSIRSKPICHQTLPLTLQASALHSEELPLFVLPRTEHPLILGLPWLKSHDPVISWSQGEIVAWSSHCFNNCLALDQLAIHSTSVESPDSVPCANIPVEYSDFSEVFSKTNATKLPPHRPSDCAIDLVEGATLPKARVYPLTRDEEKAMEEYVSEALAQGFIRPSKSPVGSGFFFVKKKDGGLRPCIDYRGLNDITKKFAYPLPLIPVALEQLRGASYFSKLDLRSAYNLIRIREGDEWKTAFSTTRGHYEYLVMSYGLANAPAVFQSFMNDIFRDMLDKFVIIFIDDILIYSPDMPTHIQHVRLVLQRLLEHRLFAKAEKCEFHKQRIAFLGYIISSTGVTMNDEKVSAVTSWPVPQTIKDLQRFLGFANFYRRFIRNFSTIASPLTALTKHAAKTLTWSPSAQQAFDSLKTAFSSAPILKHPNPELPFVVEVDASESGVGAVLSQRSGSPPKLFPIAFFSRKLSSAECNYGIGDRELLAVKMALEEWRHWLEGAVHPFIVYTDHKNLEYLKTAKRLNSRQARWSLFFSRFDFSISFRPGDRNTKADALSRVFSTSENIAGNDGSKRILPPSVTVAVIRWELDDQIAEVNSGHPPPADCPSDKTYVPLRFRDQLIMWAHSALSSGHPGETRTLQLLSARYWWESMRADIHSVVSSCSVCAQCKTPKSLPAGKLMPLPVPERPWSHIAVDFVTDLPPSDGFTTILTVVDRFSRGVKFIPLISLPTAFQTAQAIYSHIFRHYGIPEDILSDRGPQFTSRVWRAFFEHLGVNVSLTSGFHPTSNGQCERVNQELGKFLRLYCHAHPSDWSQYLIWAEIAQNSLTNTTSGLTPFQCILGFQPPLAPWTAVSTDVPAVDEWMTRSEQVWEETHQQVSAALNRYKEQADRRRGDTPRYQLGDRVWLSTRDFRFEGSCRKLLPRFIGPFRVLSQVNEVTYKLELPAQYKVNNAFHVSLLKPLVPGPLAEGAPADVPPTAVEGEDSTTYAIREVLDSRRRGGVLQYLIDWEGFGPEERSWVAAKDVLDPVLLANFHARHPGKPAPRPRGRPRRSLSGSAPVCRGSRSLSPRLPGTSAAPAGTPCPSGGRRRGRPRSRPAPVSSGGGGELSHLAL
uniref:Gypsy retrotransposon integrase-like protein 1 n=1 Tax=Astyanax mexicanus TaxID=7994 RepID=A0A3B1KEA5_ASTMX